MDPIQMLENLIDAVCESIENMTDEEILQEAKEQGIDLEAEQRHFQVMIEAAIECARKENG